MTTIEVIMNLMKSDPSENEIDEWVSSHITIGVQKKLKKEKFVLLKN